MNPRHKRSLTIQSGCAGLLAIAGWFALVDPIRSSNAKLVQQLDQMDRTLAEHEEHAKSTAEVERKILIIADRSRATTEAFYHVEPTTEVYEKLTSLAGDIGISLDRIKPSKSSTDISEGGVGSIEHTIGFVARIDHVLRFIDALERANDRAMIVDFRARPAPSADGGFSLAVELRVTHPLLGSPIEPWGPIASADSASQPGDTP